MKTLYTLDISYDFLHCRYTKRICILCYFETSSFLIRGFIGFTSSISWFERCAAFIDRLWWFILYIISSVMQVNTLYPAQLNLLSISVFSWCNQDCLISRRFFSQRQLPEPVYLGNLLKDTKIMFCPQRYICFTLKEKCCLPIMRRPWIFNIILVRNSCVIIYWVLLPFEYFRCPLRNRVIQYPKNHSQNEPLTLMLATGLYQFLNFLLRDSMKISQNSFGFPFWNHFHINVCFENLNSRKNYCFNKTRINADVLVSCTRVTCSSKQFATSSLTHFRAASKRI